MQLRCFKCHKPFAIGKDAVYAGLDTMEAEDLQHYNAQCPHCKRMNRVSREELLRAAPNWKPAAEGEEVEE
jgi:phage FluMu protein Com